MVVQNTDATSLAQQTQIPPELRKFAQDDMTGVTKIRRFRIDEYTCRGWTIIASSANLRNLPDGYSVTRVNTGTKEDSIVMTIREQ